MVKLKNIAAFEQGQETESDMGATKKIRVLFCNQLNLARGKSLTESIASSGQAGICKGVYSVTYSRQQIPLIICSLRILKSNQILFCGRVGYVFFPTIPIDKQFFAGY
ncbi:MAG: hypothetical protein ACJAS9_000375 [Polaribacter sp.]|jgi:hypothetical protein